MRRWWRMERWLVFLGALAACAALRAEESRVLEPRLIHLRSGAEREWSEFPAEAEGDQLERTFAAKPNEREWTLHLRQQDVKQAWRVTLNDRLLGELARDENDAVTHWGVPPGTLRLGENRLRIAPTGRGASDDIRVGEITLVERAPAAWTDAGRVAVQVTDERGAALPCRLTISDRRGALMPTSAVSGGPLAVRTGVIYTATGEAEFGLPTGDYVIYAGRGFEYSLARAEVTIGAEQRPSRPITLRLTREVPTDGYVACDPHIHTLTFSGHGDATIDERMITLAGEGIELPIATDHNVHIDFEAHAQRLGVRQYFTPVVGNEVTTPVGHFNIFPVRDDAPPPDHRLTDWPAIFSKIFRTPETRVVILNHARDLHSGRRPFGPQFHNAAVGKNLDGWPLRFHAMEVINSGATQSDPLELTRDWLALLNRGYAVAPIGSSDSHDVARHFVGQGRTYIRCANANPAAIDVRQAIDSLLAGRVLVSYGLLVELRVEERFGPGDLAAVEGDTVSARLRVLGPHWVAPERVELYANGTAILQRDLPPRAAAERPAPGVWWDEVVTLPRPRHDVHWVAVALGPGIDASYWKTAKPYQPTSPDWRPRTFACSGAVWLDGDADGRRSSPADYAQRLLAEAGGSWEKMLPLLAPYDAATAAQAAALHHEWRPEVSPEQLLTQAAEATEPVRQGVAAYFKAWRDNELARRE
jgi:hypothetical protein